MAAVTPDCAASDPIEGAAVAGHLMVVIPSRQLGQGTVIVDIEGSIASLIGIHVRQTGHSHCAVPDIAGPLGV